MATAKKSEEKIKPLYSGDFGAIEHKVPRFNADVPGALTKDDLENPDLWVNVARGMTMGSEIRCIADDMSFVAFGVCTFVQGSMAKIKIYGFHELDKVNYDEIADPASKFETKFRGPKKWSIINKDTGEIVREDIQDQVTAVRELSDYQKALRS